MREILQNRVWRTLALTTSMVAAGLMVTACGTDGSGSADSSSAGTEANGARAGNSGAPVPGLVDSLPLGTSGAGSDLAGDDAAGIEIDGWVDASAGTRGGNGPGHGGESGPHWQFNIIGHPKNVDAISGDDSNGRAIMVPLQNATGPDEIVCEADQVIVTDDLEPTFTDQEPTGAKIYFVAGDHFEIIDRDGTDSNGARIMVPTTDAASGSWITFDIFIRVLGKPMTCMDIDAYAFDADQSLYFWAGSVDLNRKPGRSTFVKVNELFDVWFCQVDTTTGECTEGTTEEISVFNNVFESYFWNILNNGTRNVQVRLYPR